MLRVKQDADIFTPNGKTLKLIDQFTYLGSNISSTESDVNIHIGKAWTTRQITDHIEI